MEHSSNAQERQTKLPVHTAALRNSLFLHVPCLTIPISAVRLTVRSQSKANPQSELHTSRCGRQSVMLSEVQAERWFQSDCIPGLLRYLLSPAAGTLKLVRV